MIQKTTIRQSRGPMVKFIESPVHSRASTVADSIVPGIACTTEVRSLKIADAAARGGEGRRPPCALGGRCRLRTPLHIRAGLLCIEVSRERPRTATARTDCALWARTAAIARPEGAETDAGVGQVRARASGGVRVDTCVAQHA
jgi:hypothetical protein